MGMTGTKPGVRTQLIATIDRPLGFYVLSLLIIETMIGLVAGTHQDSDATKLGLCLGAGLFVYVTLIVTALVWFKAHVLTFDRDAHMADRNIGTMGTSQKALKKRAQLPPAEKAPQAASVSNALPAPGTRQTP